MPQFIFFLIFSTFPIASFCYQKPHIILVIADDLGWNDVGFHNPDMITPHIDAAAYSGIILNSSYVQPLCSPSRAAIMTGYHPFKTGMQAAIRILSESGLPLQFKLLPEVLKELGYSTHLIGKWHLGSCNASYFPTNRGFDTFFGFLEGAQYFYSHTVHLSNNSIQNDRSQPHIYDFWNQTTSSLEYKGIYSSLPFMLQLQNVLEKRADGDQPMFITMAFQGVHTPIEVDREELLWYPNEKNRYRKEYSALVTQLDNDFGKLVNMLKVYGIYNESIIIFISDNGGAIWGGGNNYPLKGSKATVYEGGTRAVNFIHSPLLKNTGYTYNGLVHAVDWFSIISGLAGGEKDKSNDGVNSWRRIIKNKPSLRKGFVYHLTVNQTGHLHGAIRYKQWKLIIGSEVLPNTNIKPKDVTGTFFDSFGAILQPDPNPQSFQLYNIHDDPTESNNLASTHVKMVETLYHKAKKHQQAMVKSVITPNNMNKYINVTTNLEILNTNWCKPIEKVTPLH